MKSTLSMLKHPALRRQGAPALEWVLLITIVVIGGPGGLAAVRNATVQEFTDLSKAAEQIKITTAAETGVGGT